MCEYNVRYRVRKEGGLMFKFDCSSGKCSLIVQDLLPRNLTEFSRL